MTDYERQLPPLIKNSILVNKSNQTNQADLAIKTNHLNSDSDMQTLQ